MMKRYLFVALMMGLCFAAQAQVHKIFVNKRGNITKDSLKAASYKLYQRLPDSSWLVAEYDMRNTLMFKGTYLDEELTMPHGKAAYYKLVVNQRPVAEHQSVMDTVLRVYRTGYYLNGKKEGSWVDYFLNGNKQSITPFEADTLNGLYQEFDYSGRLLREGNYVKGDKEGDWNLYYTDSTLQISTKFRRNHLVDMTEYQRDDQMYGAYPNFKFHRYILKSLKDLGLPPITGNVIVSFTINEDGALVDPKLEVGVDPVLDTAIMNAIIKSPKWVSAKKKNIPVSQTSSFVFSYRNVKGDE